MNDENKHGNINTEKAQDCSPAPKWAAVVNDTLVEMPQSKVRVEVLRFQAKIADDQVLIRDQNSEHDPMIPKDGIIDLAEGNVFYSVPECDARQRPVCAAPPKLAFVVNDKWEIVTRPDQTGHSLRKLFSLSKDVEILRDLVSPNDRFIGEEDAVQFADGCVFRTTHEKRGLFIIVNKRRFAEKDGVKPVMTGLQIAALDSDQPQNTRVEKITSTGSTEVGLDETIKIECGDEFRVIRKNINAGFQLERIDRELNLLREGGARVTLVQGAVPAVIYHDVPVRAGKPVAQTDVLVKIPAGYPGGILDNAFLPSGSPLLNCTPGAVQQAESIGSAQWIQKSLHPHAGNGTPWNKDRHGLHTYYAEIQNWLNVS